jgi:4-amino-4-deoxy-L-arabinose transferase-like glycosyltransferase
MTSQIFRRVSAAALVALSYALVWLVWTKHQALFPTLLLLGGAAVIIGLLGASETQALPLVHPSQEKGTGAAWGGLLAALFIAAVTAWAFHAMRAEAWVSLTLALLLGAVGWRFSLPADGGELPVWARWGLLAVVAAAAALFRLYKAGSIPEGFAGVDETGLWCRAQEIAKGLRISYVIGTIGADGAIPAYIEAAGLKIFGQGFWGWRMEGIVTGIALTFLIYRIGKEIAGTWAGLFSAALWAVGLWPVTISRAEYYMVETLLLTLGFLVLFLAALRRGNGLLYGLAGLILAFCFNIYPAARILALLLPLLYLLIWLQRPQERKPLLGGMVPMGGAFLVGLSPLLWWMTQESYNIRHYASAFYTGNQIGDLAGHSLFSGLNDLSYRAALGLPMALKHFNLRGSNNPFYFPLDYPIFHPAFMVLFLVGLTLCVARFRRPLHAFLIFWWFAGLLPELVSIPGTLPNDRRAIMALPPTLIIAGLGLAGSLETLTAMLRQRTRDVLILVLALPFFVWVGQASWHDYFERNQKDYTLMSWDRVNSARIWRVVFEENKKGPVALVSTRRLNADSWFQPGMDPYRGQELPASNPDVPVAWVQDEAGYYQRDGFLEQLKWSLNPKAGVPAGTYDTLVVLVPFYYYLQPVLEKLGGKVVAEIPLATAKEGVLRGDVSFGYHPSVAAKLIRIHGLSAAAIDDLRPAYTHTFKMEELSPPAPYTREGLLRLDEFGADYRKVVKRYVDSPGSWRPGRKMEMHLSDPWFWTTHGNLPGALLAPYRIKASFKLKIGEAGSYAIGASSTLLTTLWVDGRRVFQRDPLDPAQWAKDPPAEFMRDPGILEMEHERKGYLGTPLQLSAGTHRLDVEVVCFSILPSFSNLIRVIWQTPGAAEPDTLPLEVLEPVK